MFPQADGVRWSLLTATPLFGLLGLPLLVLGRRDHARSLDATDALAAATSRQVPDRQTGMQAAP